jgi:hypothetical protein
MLKEEDFAELADIPPDLAFVRLERKFRAIYQHNINDSQSNELFFEYMREYMNHTIAAAEALGLDFLEDVRVKLDNSEIPEELKRLTTAVDRFAVQVQITHVRNPPRDSVTLEGSEKLTLRHYVTQIKEVIDKSALLVAKKERLFDRINAFLAEVDRDRTGLQKFNDLVISLAHTGGDAAQELEPTWKWVKLIAQLLGARQENEQAKLPPQTKPKRLEPPKRQISPPKPLPKPKDEFDDEIPF